MTAQNNSDVSTSANVTMASFHTPIRPSPVSVATLKMAMRLPPICQLISPAMMMNTVGGTDSRLHCTPSNT
ncbi:Uncharacterised protein [Pseudomonas fluorescens]|uniref:Uncharacterized protein n=1 Tax=Pseudomonas fluorescens TaxID=294 RepID=A0A3S4PG35_PSEFL|nr:Uncharacterised protein [Pseudomonas fluorescens]